MQRAGTSAGERSEPIRRVIRWRSVDRTELAAPPLVAALLERAIAADPANMAARSHLAELYLARRELGTATELLEGWLRLDPAMPGMRQRLAHCYNAVGRHRDALALLAGSDAPELERALALADLTESDAAERELRAILAEQPAHRSACRYLSRLLRRAGRTEDLLALCDGLYARGVRHSMLLYSWGGALALSGQDELARALLFDRARIAEMALPVPDGFADGTEFAATLAEEFLSNPHRVSEFPSEHANSGSSRVHALLGGRRPELVQALIEMLQRLIDEWQPPRYGAFDPWDDARPAEARLRPWALFQHGDQYEHWHLHPSAWLSGVYYVQLPPGVTGAGEGAGCIEFGPPSSVTRALPEHTPVWRYVPRVGRLLLAPSHYAHRTIPSGNEACRISFAFDVLPLTDEPAGVAETA